MKFGFSAGCGAVMATALFSQGLAAQSLRDWDSNAGNDVRASAAITIPLGGPSQNNESKPRLEFSFETQRMDGPSSVTPLRFDPDFERQTLQTARFAFTLEQNPRLLFNGERIATFGPRLTAEDDQTSRNKGGGGGETVLYIVGGVAALAGLTAILIDEVDEVFEAPLRELTD